MLFNIAKLKRKHGKIIFDYFQTKYGIEKATIYLNSFFEKNWHEIPGQDILEILMLFDSDPDPDEVKELRDKLDTIIDNMQKMANELKLLRKQIR